MSKPRSAVLDANRVRLRVYQRLFREFIQGALTEREYRQEVDALLEYLPQERRAEEEEAV